MRQEGKLTFIGFIIIILIVYGGFVAVKLISTNLTESQIENKVKDTFGMMRGSGFDEAEGEDAIRDILTERDDIILDENHVIDVELDKNTHTIKYFFEYEVETNFLLFKSRKKIEVNESMRSYD